MKDEEYMFTQDVREKKIVARSSRSARTHCGKRGRVKLPSDYMTKKEKDAMNGECKSYRLNEPMNWEEFKAMPDDIKVTFIKALKSKYNVTNSALGNMFGVDRNAVTRYLEKLGFPPGTTGNKKWDKEGFITWWKVVPAAIKEEPDEAPEASEVVAEIKEEDIPAEQDQTTEEKVTAPEVCMGAIPISGTMMFKGCAADALKTVAAMLRDANVHISITWDVLEDEDG